MFRRTRESFGISKRGRIGSIAWDCCGCGESLYVRSYRRRHGHKTSLFLFI